MEDENDVIVEQEADEDLSSILMSEVRSGRFQMIVDKVKMTCF